MERELGWAPGWWHGRSRTGDLSTQQLLAVLDYLGLDPVRFVRQHVGSELGLELDKPLGVPPAFVQQALRRTASAGEGTGLGLRFLEGLDRRRYDAPAQALALAEGAVETIERELLPRLLGVAASSLRLLVRLEEAQHVALAGLELARLLDLPDAFGDLLQRMSYISADRGNHLEALRLAEAAAIRHLRSGQKLAFPRALVDQGMWLHYLGDFHESIAVEGIALDLLQPCDARNRITAHHFIALSYRELGDREQALVTLKSAQAEASGETAWAKPKLDWLEGLLQWDLGNLGEAECALQRAATSLERVHLGDAALVTCDLIRVKLSLGEFADAFQVAKEMLRLVEPLRQNEIVSSAIADLLRNGRAGLTLALVENITSQIASERRHHAAWAALRVRS